jgi:arsenate reductase-like glutaredoxin family protein
MLSTILAQGTNSHITALIMPATSIKAINNKKRNHNLWASRARLAVTMKSKRLREAMQKEVAVQVQKRWEAVMKKERLTVQRLKEFIKQKDEAVEELRQRSNKHMREASSAKKRASQKELMWKQLVCKYGQQSAKLATAEYWLERMQHELRASQLSEKKLRQCLRASKGKRY